LESFPQDDDELRIFFQRDDLARKPRLVLR
jgi:hypothetical protein